MPGVPPNGRHPRSFHDPDRVQYREEGDSFKPRYLEILSTGGSDSPVRTLERAGIDVASPDFWNGGFQVVDEALQKLEAMPVEASSSNGKSDTK